MADNEIHNLTQLFYRSAGTTTKIVVGELYRFYQWDFRVYENKPVDAEHILKPNHVNILKQEVVFTLLEISEESTCVYIKVLSSDLLGWVRLVGDDIQYLERVVDHSST